MVRSTVVQGLKAPLAAASAMTMAVSAPVMSACPHRMSPVRQSSAENGKRSLANSGPMASTLMPLASTHGAKFCTRMALAASAVSWGMTEIHAVPDRQGGIGGTIEVTGAGSYTAGRQTRPARRHRRGAVLLWRRGQGHTAPSKQALAGPRRG